MGTDGGGAADEVLLGEVLALRTILLNLMFSLTNGKPVTPEAMQELIARADGDKARKAMERLTAVRATVPEQEPASQVEPEPTAVAVVFEKPDQPQNPPLVGHQGLVGEIGLSILHEGRREPVTILLHYAEGSLSLLELIWYNFPDPVPASWTEVGHEVHAG